eukprot:CAMPEP_0183453256 /NCGR_PEP_ID=MMETSP0370-20130417/120446_1 /TAXON_ID=268820 /ORGANISM="Peridinium aciculiferum, Strain PAER-2" /LENGTH=114 /DNA_ID=CAMNT_0025644633 /DNA_START=24 /DNA_END=368 /DNA_ORIENTATION=+
MGLLAPVAPAACSGLEKSRNLRWTRLEEDGEGVEDAEQAALFPQSWIRSPTTQRWVDLDEDDEDDEGEVQMVAEPRHRLQMVRDDSWTSLGSVGSRRLPSIQESDEEDEDEGDR